tara:strand:+ start:1568 stop:1771 length:204 start_codon:yes stop_codon:yes gene_type:complete
MPNFVDPQFVDLILSRLNDLEQAAIDKLVSGSIRSFEDYSQCRGEIEGIQKSTIEIKQVAEKVFSEE